MRVAKSKVKAVEEFLASPDRVLVCTHATFRFAVDELGVEAFDDCLIAVDEFHHVSAGEDNKLGAQLAALIAHDRAHIVAMTGSHFCGDAVPVLSPEDEARFETVTYALFEPDLVPRKGSLEGEPDGGDPRSPCARLKQRLGALQPIMRAEFRREAAIAHDQVRGVGRKEPRMKAVRVAATGVRADGIVHEDVAVGDDQDEGGAELHALYARRRWPSPLSVEQLSRHARA